MWQYLVKRLLLLLLTLFGISLISFLVMTLIPGDPAYTAAGIQQVGGKTRGKTTDEVLEYTRKALYLDRPTVINLAPNTRTKVAREYVKKICEGTEYQRHDVQNSVVGEMGTAGLDVFVAEGRKRAAAADVTIAANK